MMTTLTEIEENDDYTFSIFEECLDKCRNVPALVSIKQVIELPNGSSEAVDISKFVVNAVTKILINNNMFYVRLVTAVESDLSHVYSAWETVLERGTNKFEKGEANDYAMVIDFAKEDRDKGYVYIMSYANPMFIGREDDALLLVYNIENMRFDKTTVDFVQVYDEVQYAEEVQRAADKREEEKEKEYDENDDVISNNDVLSNDEFLM